MVALEAVSKRKGPLRLTVEQTAQAQGREKRALAIIQVELQDYGAHIFLRMFAS